MTAEVFDNSGATRFNSTCKLQFFCTAVVAPLHCPKNPVSEPGTTSYVPRCLLQLVSTPRPRRGCKGCTSEFSTKPFPNQRLARLVFLVMGVGFVLGGIVSLLIDLYFRR